MDNAETLTPIEHHGLIGDLLSCALVSRDGAVTFFCAPQFDSPTVFARLLDPAGGCFRIAPARGRTRTSQMYYPDTNVLLTRFMSEEGILEVADLMPVHREDPGPQRIQRTARVVRGSFDVVAECSPRFDYGRMAHTLEAGVFRPQGPGPVLRLLAEVPMQAVDGALTARFRLEQGQSVHFVLEVDPDVTAPSSSLQRCGETFHGTVEWWRAWSAQSRYQGRWREVVMRSVLALKLLTSRPHGAPVAAATFGLPELVGGARNWDYRFVWIRDASFAMYAFIRLGLIQEAEDFVDWIAARVRGAKHDQQRLDGNGPLRVAYSLEGENHLPEAQLALAGYGGSTPVRVGNEAAQQFQLDIYGELMDAVYLANKYGRAISYDDWSGVRRLVDWIGENWQRPDSGIWEGRGEQKTFLHSRLMLWVAVDRAVRLAAKRSLPAPLPEWNALLMAIHGSIHEAFWREDLNSFVQYPGSDSTDGAMLLMPLVRFISPRDPRWLGTMALIHEQLVEDALVHRRPAAERALDGLDGEEGAFLACSFWYVECLARQGELSDARLLFEKLLAYGSPLGLYAEELSNTGRQLGNYPQALTHLALISAASYLDRKLGSERPQPWS